MLAFVAAGAILMFVLLEDRKKPHGQLEAKADYSGHRDHSASHGAAFEQVPVYDPPATSRLHTNNPMTNQQMTGGNTNKLDLVEADTDDYKDEL